ncbi:hypothetical protein PCASD_15739 [Puccinia coronata f. sp. avenae]|uniref:Uncharacterized protein n=1 Tax=Puccinia coronata f. sp. avenae TaxID=200324 RepID=A0A2N5U794_9BASI|nr:hypothetical protein PCASD_15739 [Puccinia coronata f. sp. avenae]
MRFAGATAGVLVMATFSRARSIARGPATPSQSHETTQALHLVSAVHHSIRSTGGNDDWKNSTNNSPHEDRDGDAMSPGQHASPKDSGPNGRVYESSATENSRERPVSPNSMTGTEHEDHTPPAEPDSTKDSGSPGRVHEYTARDSRDREVLPTSSNSTDHEDPTPPAKPEGQKDSGTGRVHEYSAQDSRERQILPASSNGAEHEDHTPPAEPDSTKDSGHNDRVHEYSAKETSNDLNMVPTSPNRAEDEDRTPPGEPDGQKDYGNGRVQEYSAQDSRERQAFPTSSNGAGHEDHTPSGEPEGTKDSGHKGRVHEYSAQDESIERRALPTLVPLGTADNPTSPTVGAQSSGSTAHNPTAILLQAIREYHEAMHADDSSEEAHSPPSGFAKPARHMLQVFPLLKYQTKPVRPTIHELSRSQNITALSAGSRAVQQNHLFNSTDGTPRMAFGNLSSLSNTPLSSNLPISAINRDLLNISSLSNNSPPMSSPEKPFTDHDTSSNRDT